MGSNSVTRHLKSKYCVLERKERSHLLPILFLLEINEVVSPVVSNDLVFLGWSQFVLAQPITIGQLLKMQGVIISRFTPHHPSSSAGQ